jgi:hypothetical protein
MRWRAAPTRNCVTAWASRTLPFCKRGSARSKARKRVPLWSLGAVSMEKLKNLVRRWHYCKHDLTNWINARTTILSTKTNAGSTWQKARSMQESLGTQSIQSGCQPATAGLQGLEGWTPTLSAASGTLTSVTVSSAVFYEIEKRVDFWFLATITTNGSATGAFKFTLPFTAVLGQAYGEESALSGNALLGSISGNVCSVTTYNNGYPGANGAVIKVQGTFFRS